MGLEVKPGNDITGLYTNPNKQCPVNFNKYKSSFEGLINPLPPLYIISPTFVIKSPL